MLNYTHWFPTDVALIHDYTQSLSSLHRVCVSPGGTGVAVTIVTDSEELLQYCVDYLPVVDEQQSKATFYYLLHTTAPYMTPRGVEPLQRYSATVPYNDAAVDWAQKVVLMAGIRHYGLLKSIVSGIQSCFAATPMRQGFHGAAFQINHQGCVLLGSAAAGKTSLVMPLLHAYPEMRICTDDWCDVVLLPHDGVYAIGVEQNVSFNTSTIHDLVIEKRLPQSFALKPHVPHGYRDKVVAQLNEIAAHVVSQVPVNVVFVMTNVETARVEEDPDPVWLAEEIAHTSGHMPFHYLRQYMPTDEQWRASRTHFPQSTHCAEAVMQQSRLFAHNLAARIRSRQVTLVLLPDTHRISVSEKVHMIRTFIG